MNNSDNTKRNICYGWINNGIKIVLPFLSRTIIIYAIGIEYIGLGSLFSSVLGVLSLAELGFDASIMYLMYSAIAENDYERIGALQLYIKKVYFLIGVIILIFGVATVPFLDYLVKDASELPDGIQLELVYLIYLSNSVVSYFFGGYKQGLLKCCQRNDVISKIDSICLVSVNVFQISALILTHNYYLYILLKAVITIAENLIIKYASKRVCPHVIERGRIREEDRIEIRRLVYGSFLSRIGSVLSVSFDNLICSVYLGITVLAYYSNYEYISNSIISFLAIIYASMQGAIGRNIAIKSKEENCRDLYIFSFIYIWIVIWAGGSLFMIASQFIFLWLNGSGVIPSYVMLAVAINFFALMSNSILGTYKEAAGIFWEDRYRGILSGAVNLVLNLIMVNWLKDFGGYFALLGIILSTTISVMVISVPWAVKITFQKYFKKSARQFYVFLIKMILSYALILGLMYWIDCAIPLAFGVKGMIHMMFRIVIGMLFPNIVLYFIFRRSPLFMESRHYLMERLLRKKRGI